MGRHRSLKSKITSLRTLIVPQILILFAVLFAPFCILEKVDKVLLSFLWNNKTPKIKRETIIASIEEGGLKMPDIFEINKAAKITWVKRLAIETDGKWKDLMYKLLNIDRQHFVFKMTPAYVDACKTKFHKQLMKSSQDIYKKTAPSSYNEILNEYIFHSSLITLGNDALNVQKFGSFYKQNNFLKLIDIFDKTTCNIMVKQALETKFKCCLNYMQFFMLKSAIPALWIKKLKSSSTENIDRSPDSIFIKLGHKLVNIEHMKTKDIYAQLLSKKTILLSAINV